MKNPLRNILNAALIILLVSAPLIANANVVTDIVGFAANSVIDTIARIVGTVLLSFMSLLTMLSGTALNYVVYHTIVGAASGPFGLDKIPAIDETWATVRDVANMGFIFVLLYAAIKTILGMGENNQRLIRNIVIAAVLMNFSLFLTKVVIDAANILALFFYSSMFPNVVDADGTYNIMSTGISNAFVDLLNLQTLWQAGGAVNASNIITVGLLGSVVLLITAFVFLAVTLLLTIRYVVLILVLILSPIFVVSYVFPGGEIKKYASQWKDALIGQAFFAPIYMFLTWVTLRMLQALPFNEGEAAGGWAAALGGTIEAGAEGGAAVNYLSGSIQLIFQFAVIIIFMIVSLVVAKSWASKGPSFLSDATKWAVGTAGKYSFGAAGLAGRRVIGGAGTAIGDSEFLKKRADQAGFWGATSRLGLRAGRNVGKANFDLRATAVGKSLDAGKAQRGGYAAELKASAEAKKKFGESLGPSDITKEKVKQNVRKVGDIDENSERFQKEWAREKNRREQEVKRLMLARAAAKNDEERAEIQEKLDQAQKDFDSARTASAYKDELRDNAQAKADEILGVNEEEAKKRLKAEGKTEEWLKSEEGKAEIKKVQVTGAGKKRKENYASTLMDPRWIKSKLNPNVKISRSSKQAAADLRKDGKKVEDIVKDALKANKEVSEPENKSGGEEGKEGGEEKKGG